MVGGFCFFSFFVCVFVGLPGRDNLTSAPYKCPAGVLQNRNIPQTNRNTGKAATRSNSCNTLPNLTLWRSGRTHALPCSTITHAASHRNAHIAPYRAQPPGFHDTVPRSQHKRAARWRSASALLFLREVFRVDLARQKHPETSWNIPLQTSRNIPCGVSDFDLDIV